MSQFQPQQPYYQQQPVQPPLAPKKPGRGKFFAIGCGGLTALVILIIVIVVASGGGSSSTTPSTSATQPAQQATTAPASPTAEPKWTTTHTFTGNGIKKTAVFTAPDDWKIVWKCDPASFDGSYNVIVDVTSPDGTPIDTAVNTICKAGNTGDSTEEHQGGQVYLDVNSEGSWTIQVQELR